METELKRLQLENNELRKIISKYQNDDTKNHNSLLSSDQILRYSRQLLVPQIGTNAQIHLSNSKVLVIGAGGLGSSLLPYLAGSGIGTIGIIDSDVVERSNLHRQVLYKDNEIGLSKVLCAKRSLLALNPTINVETHYLRFTHENSIEMVKGYDLVIDASDNPLTRYIVNDSCVLVGDKPLISGSAMGLEGQVTVYNYNDLSAESETKGPCYRCIFPKPLPTEAGRSCSDNGVLGPVTGLIGSIQAIEAIKIIGKVGKVLSGKMCTFDAFNSSFYEFEVGSRNKDCVVCGDNPSITNIQQSFEWCQQMKLDCNINSKLPNDLPSISCYELKEAMKESFGLSSNTSNDYNSCGVVVIDVRPKVQFDLCSLKNSINIPLSELIEFGCETKCELNRYSNNGERKIVMLCRRGNASRKAVMWAKEWNVSNVYNVVGGLQSWRSEVDSSFPEY